MRRLLVVLVVVVLGTSQSSVQAEHETSASATIHVVQRGDWLWKIAREQLRQRGPGSFSQDSLSQVTPEPTALEVRAQAEVIYQDNRDVIGRNRNRLRPGQRLRLRPMATLIPQGPCTPPPGSGCA